MRSILYTLVLYLGLTGYTQAAIFSFNAGDFTLNPVFSTVEDFTVSIEIDGPLEAGGTYGNTDIVSVDYGVSGTLAKNTPSGFRAFDLIRNGIDQTEFVAQGSTFTLEVSPTADLSDGLQRSEITNLVLNFIELGTGRYHPPVFQIGSDGTGSIRNAANSGGVNPSTGMVVDVEEGEEYITEFTFDPAMLTLSQPLPPAPVPLNCYTINSSNNNTITFCL